MALADQRCEACTGSTPALTPDEVTDALAELHAQWTVVDATRLRRDLRFADFSTAFAMATRVALLAEEQGHHPDITVGWGSLRIELTTHAVGRLTRNDAVMAAKIDRVAG